MLARQNISRFPNWKITVFFGGGQQRAISSSSSKKAPLKDAGIRHGRSVTGTGLGRRNVDLNFSFSDWNRHQSVLRHFRHLSPIAMGKSSTFRRLLFPDLFVVALTSSAISWWNVTCQTLDSSKVAEVAGNSIWLHESMITLPTMPFTLSAFALGLLVTFRTQSGHARYVQARMDWGAIINVTRDLSSRILARYPADRVADKRHAVRLVQTFPVALKYHLTEEGGSRTEKKESTVEQQHELETRKLKKMKAELESTIWANLKTDEERKRADDFVRRVMADDVVNRPLFVLHELSRLNASLSDKVSNGMVSVGIDDRILDLTNSLGSCERILRTPIYTSYTRHASRFLTLWCNALPIALYPLVGPEMTVPFSLVIGFVMFGIEDIGIRIEQPFSILPLWQYCEGIKSSTDQLLKTNEL